MSWTPICLDVDLDGYETCLFPTGHLHDVNDRDVSGQPKATGQGVARAGRCCNGIRGSTRSTPPSATGAT